MHVSSVPLFQIADGDDYVQGPISLEQPVGTLPIVDDARWSADLTSNSWGALAVWLVLLIVLQAAMWPLVRRVFARFPDQGWAFGRLVSLICAGYLVWILASVEIIAFRAIWCGAALIVAAVIGNLPRFWPHTGQNGYITNHAWYRNRSILTVEAVFWAVFGLFLLYRFINPDSYHPTWGGEKPMEFAHINAILRSAHFPPYDPWYADGMLNYYYYGMYLVAFMMKLTGIPSEIAFNLAQPTMIAFLAVGAFSVVSALTHSLTKSNALSRIGGLLGVVLMSFSGNLVVIRPPGFVDQRRNTLAVELQVLVLESEGDRSPNHQRISLLHRNLRRSPCPRCGPPDHGAGDRVVFRDRPECQGGAACRAATWRVSSQDGGSRH